MSYFVEVRFWLRYQVEWSHEEGTNDGPCSSWRKDDGLHVVEVFNGGGRDPRNVLRPLKPLKGRMTIYAKPVVLRLAGRTLSVWWGALEAVGAAYGSKRRVWTQEGGPTSAGCGVPPFTRLPSDCDAASSPFDVPLPFAAVYAGERKPRPRTLKDLTDLYSTRRGKPFTPVLAVTALGPAARPYRTCRTSPWAPGGPGLENIGIPVSQGHVRALRNLQVGGAVRVSPYLHGPCNTATEIPAEDTCAYHAWGWVELRRVQPNP